MKAKSRAERNFWIQAGSLLLFIGLIVSSYIWSATKPIDREELAIEIADLRSLTAAGAELSGQFSTGKLPETFFQNQLELMHEKITASRETLGSPNTGTEVPLELDSARSLAEKIDVEFDRLLSDERYAERGKHELAGLKESLKRLEDQLKQGAQK